MSMTYTHKDTDTKVEQYVKAHKSTGFNQAEWNITVATIAEEDRANAEAKAREELV